MESSPVIVRPQRKRQASQKLLDNNDEVKGVEAELQRLVLAEQSEGEQEGRIKTKGGRMKKKGKKAVADDGEFAVSVTSCAGSVPNVKKRVRNGSGGQGPAAARAKAPDNVIDSANEAYLALSKRERCTCVVLYGFSVDVQRAVASRRGDIDAKASEAIIAALCAVCGTVEASKTAIAAYNKDREGVQRQIWMYSIADLEKLSIRDALHLYLTKVHHTNPHNLSPPDLFDLDRFRAHLVKHLRTNWDYYVVRGRENNLNVPGSISVPSPLMRRCNFTLATTSMIDNHYQDVHHAQYCGRLRSLVGRCAPFKCFAQCDNGPLLKQILSAGIKCVQTFVARYMDVDSVVNPVPEGLQHHLKEIFGL